MTEDGGWEGEKGKHEKGRKVKNVELDTSDENVNSMQSSQHSNANK